MDAEGLSAAALADLAGVTEAEVRRLVGLGVLAGRDAAGPFLASDAQKVRLAEACERAGLPMEGIAAAIRAGRLSFAFLEAAPYRRWSFRSARTYRQVSQDTGIPLDLLGRILESMGFARMAPDEPIREDELEVVPLLELAHSMGSLDHGLARIGRAYAQGLRVVAAVEKEDYTARFARLVRESGGDRGPGRGPRRPGRAVLARARGRTGEDAGRRGDGPLPRPRRGGAGGAADGRGAPRGGLPPAHAGVAAGPVVAQGGDYFGRTVNLAARIAARARPPAPGAGRVSRR
jgi:hypothetical protein